MSEIKEYTKEYLEELCKESRSYSQVVTKSGRKNTGGNREYLKKKIEEYGVDISHFVGQKKKD